ncbi:MAG: DNA translocase FtsK [Candidatus Levybacteria bacterium CG_4_10_14_0_8_um_filter_35_23]|nr:MAG: DNA translocase FtsK [Candidatus Levybacteria bacterium CG22_combo_CG10-13_8_21_14_all_35_11]PIY95090.1 MAG: DNA translocase FtsK [Candidatus Levybacteria bacterium CG_4_10_14_0_8_um_filter_35_23]PJC54072.1 MAG: DNA translocase FtsK [Candidatus Levybacteria bacterium CG_4_9_14_0_2_um_filter_35_21]
MAKRRPYRTRKPKLKLKLKKNTIYSLFSFGLILTGLILSLSFTRNGNSFIILNDTLISSFGFSAYIFPLGIILLGFLFLRLKIFLSKPNVALGFLLFFVSFAAVSRGGIIGGYLFQIIADVLMSTGAYLVYLFGMFVGLIVLFDTSMDKLFNGIIFIFSNLGRLFPSKFVDYFKKDKIPSLNNNRQMTIKGMDKNFPSAQNAREQQSTVPVKKDSPLIADKLVQNTLGKNVLWEYPPLSLLSDTTAQKAERGDIKKTASVIEKTLQSFGVGARVVEVNLGPAVTQYALEISQGTKISKITSLSNDLALTTEAPTGQIRIEAPIPGRSLVGIEIPNRGLEVVPLKTMLASDVMRKNKSKLTVSLGLDVSGNPLVADLAKMPHVLIAGTTGSGKSVLINAFIASLLFRASPDELKLILIDPKRVELTGYNGIPHLMTSVIVEVEKILAALNWALAEMDRRYKTFAEHGVRNIDSFNELSGFQALPYIVIFIDELADLMSYAPVAVEDAITRLAQMARATGIHLVVATQRPSVDVITGLIKANIPCRIAFNVSSMVDSRVILDTPGAEKLLGRGDMLYVPPEQAKPTRIQGAFVSEKEVRKLVENLKAKNFPVEYTEEVTTQSIPIRKGMASTGGNGKDVLFEEAIRIICEYDKASASLLQRRLSIGYSRAARILDQLEEQGVVGRSEGSKPRDVLVKNADEFLANFDQS